MRHIRKFILLIFLTLSVAVSFAQSKVKIYEHTIKRGETLTQIARKYHTSISSIKRLNPWISIDKIEVGDKLLIRFNSNKPIKDEEASSESKKKFFTHTVKRGETLYSISRSYGISVRMLKKANPRLDLRDIPVGYHLRIPQLKRDKTKLDEENLSKEELKHKRSYPNTVAPKEFIEDTDEAIDLNDAQFVDVLILLPFEKSSYYVEFYEGFLMALKDLKSQGISIRLQVENLQDENSLKRLINADVLYGKELIIAGTTREEVELLASARKPEDAFIISPFVSMPIEDINSDNFVQMNQGAQILERSVVRRFIDTYRNMNIILPVEEDAIIDPFRAMLKDELDNQGIPYLEEYYSEGSSIRVPQNSIIVPAVADKDYALRFFKSLPSFGTYEVFAYPKWQSYGREFTQLMHQHNTIIFSSFYMNLHMSETQNFLKLYRAWFDKKVGANYPKYSLLGYDIARYFIRAYALYHENFPDFAYSLPYDGLQMDIDLVKTADGYVNKRFYWVHFSPNGQVTRHSLW